MAERRSAHRTQWAAQFAVASELCKQGYRVALTMGNHPDDDLMAESPKGLRFSVDVKGLYKKNYWAVREKPEKPGLYYVFAFVPDDAHNEFYVADQSTVNRLIRGDRERTRKKRLQKGSSLEKLGRFPGIRWDDLEKECKGAWSILPR